MRRGSDGARVVNDGFDRQGIPAEQARRQVMLFLDNTLFCHDRDPYRLLGLTPACSVGDIRRRHKQMLQAFHPDRHADEQEWFTDRSEQLNRAYAYLKTNHGKPGATSIPNRATVTASPAPAPAAARPGRTRRQPGPRFPDKDDLRRRLTSWLGKPSNLQQRVYVVLVTVPAVLLLLLYLNSTGPVHPPTTPAATHTVQNATPTATVPEKEPPIPADTAPDETADADQDTAAPRVLRVTHPDASARRTEPAMETARPVIPLRVTHPDAGAAAKRRILEARAPVSEPPTPAAAPRNEELPAAEPDDMPRDLASDRPNPQSVSREPAVPETEAAATAKAGPAVEDAPSTADSGRSAEPDRAPADDDAETRKETEPRLAAAIVPSAATGPPETAGSEATTEFPATIESGATTEPSATSESPAPESRSQARATWSHTSGSGTQAENATKNRDPDMASGTPVGATSHTTPESPPAEFGSPALDPEPASAEPNIHALLEAYESAYNRSDIDRFSGLFGDGARTKNAASKKDIRRMYGDLFHRTEARNLVLDEVSVRPIGERQYEVSTRFAVEWTYPDGRTGSSSGRFNLHLVNVDGELKIWRLDY